MRVDLLSDTEQSDRLWEMSDMVQLLEAFEAKQIESKKLTAVTPTGAW